LTFRVVDKELPEFMGDSQDDMSMITVEKFFRKSMGPDVCMFFSAARAGFAFTTERDNLSGSAVRTDECSEAAIFGTTFKHFFGFMDNIFRELVFVEMFEENPVVVTFKNGFKCKFFAHGKDYIKRCFESHEPRK
jgi:hypothetical protein